jgi:serine/threonine protein kinase
MLDEERDAGAEATPPATPASPASIAEGADGSSDGSSRLGGFGGGGNAAGAASVGRTPGTPAYTAPECTAAGAFSGEAADVWCALQPCCCRCDARTTHASSRCRALGVSLYAMLTGAPPFVGDTLMATCAALLMLAAVCSALARALT